MKVLSAFDQTDQPFEEFFYRKTLSTRDVVRIKAFENSAGVSERGLEIERRHPNLFSHRIFQTQLQLLFPRF